MDLIDVVTPARTTFDFARKDLLCALLFACGLILWHLPGLTLVPTVNHDEVMLNVAARNWVARGQIALTPLADVGRTYGRAYDWHPPAYLLTVALAYKLFGFSIGVTRGVSLIGGAFAGFLFFLVLRSLGVGRGAAAVVTALFIDQPLVWWLCRSGRMDLWAIAWGLLALLVVLRAPRDEPSPARMLAAGLLIGTGSLYHVLLFFWAPALLVADRVRSEQIRWKPAVLAALGAGLPLALWIAYAWFIGDRAAWIEQFVEYQLHFRSSAGGVLHRLLGALAQAAGEVKSVPFLAIFFAAALAAGWSVAGRGRRWALGGAVTAFLLVAFLMNPETGAYPLYWFTWAAIAAAPGVARLHARGRNALATLAAANLLAVNLAWVAVAIHQRQARSQERLAAFFAKEVPPGTIVMGPEDIWYAVEATGSQLRIWPDERALRHDYYVTAGNLLPVAPPGFVLKAELPDIMPKVLGKYWSATSYSYRIWVRAGTK